MDDERVDVSVDVEFRLADSGIEVVEYGAGDGASEIVVQLDVVCKRERRYFGVVRLGPDQERVADVDCRFGGAAMHLGKVPGRTERRFFPVDITRNRICFLGRVEGYLGERYTLAIEDELHAQRVRFQVVGVDDGICF